MAKCADIDHQRRATLRAISTLAIAPMLIARAGSARAATPNWPAWEVLVASSLSADGRMIDRNEPDLRTTSEGQSYALFFALVDNDQARFDRILDWTSNNLAEGELGRHLPAWLWGRDAASGQWQVLDRNPASDSDLWIAYVLLEAGRLWRRPALSERGAALLGQIRLREIRDLPGLGPMLLPGAFGFAKDDHWRLNASYLPMPLLRRFAVVDPGGPWPALAANTLRMLRETSPHGFSPNWAAWRAGGFFADPVRGALGSYDAIRVYLWAGMTHRRDPLFAALLAALGGPLRLLRAGSPMPEGIDTRTGAGEGTAPYGFRASLLPYLQAQGERRLAESLRRSLPDAATQAASAPAYYSQMLNLFGSGWFDGRYRFGRHGELVIARG